MKKSRTTLKDRFKKGAIPTEADFGDLIDSMLNQTDDNISKLPSDPLKITAIGVDEALVNFYRIENSEEKLSWQIKQKPGGKSGLSIADITASRLFIENGSGNLGAGTTAPVAKLDILQEARTATHPTAVKGLYVTGAFGADIDGSEFRRSDGTQGIGLGFNTIYAAGSAANQDLGLKPRGTGKVIVKGPLQVTGAQIQLDGAQKIIFADSDTTNNLKLQLWTNYGLGINSATLFYAADGQHSWRDAAGTNERMVLSTVANGGLTVKGTGVSSFAGNLNIGTATALAKLEVVGPVAFNDGNGIAVKSNFMSAGSLTIGSTIKNFGGGSGWNPNTAGLLMETLDNTEIAVHDSNNRLASLMYYEGAGTNRITIGRDMGPGWGPIGSLVLNGNIGIGTPTPSARLSVVAPGVGELGGTAKSPTLVTSAGPLGAATGNELALASFGFTSGNASSLGIRAYRVSAGSDWYSTAIGLGMDVDNTVRAGGASLWLYSNGNIGIGTAAPNAKLDIMQESRSGSHPAAVKGLYITGGFSPDSDGVEFRHTNGSQGIGFGYNTIYAAGSNPAQDLGLKPRGTGKVIVTGPLQVTGGLQVTGPQNLMKVKTFTLAVKNGGNGVAGTWNVDYTDQNFTEVYTVFVTFQGFSMWPNDVNFATWGHAADGNVIPQHAFARVTSSDLKKAVGQTYCSESNAGNEGDNTVLITVVVMGRN